MKQLVLSVAIVAGLSMSALAQTGPIKFGVKAGVTFPNMSVSGQDSESEDLKMTTSFYVGGTVNIPVSSIFSVQPGLTFIGKGTESEASEDLGEGFEGNYSGKAKLNPFYLEIPVNVVANFESGNGKFFLGAGPYYAMGIAGKIKVSGVATSQGATTSASVEQDIKFGDNDEDDLKSGDFGINFLAGYELKNGFNIHAGYGLGLSNVANVDSSISKVRNRVLSVGVGYTF